MLVVPVSVMVDWLVHGYILPWQAILGIIVILAGFFGLVFSECAEIFCWHGPPTHLDHEPPTHLDVAEQKANTGNVVNTRVKKSRTRYLRYII